MCGSGRECRTIYVGVVMGLGSEREFGTTYGSGDGEYEEVRGYMWEW
jgi:hypothetical protein